ncbi:hypothetical protein TWF481_002945 [Arthrobotrys musiformis]|uniref:Uncharacterized protein n=1 Tax=Arthrobotrys musiformis TaxID=47236 RepID=A0AAV9VRW8_9PEZI
MEAATEHHESKPLSEGILSTFGLDGSAKDAAKAVEFIESIDYALESGYGKERVRVSIREVIRGQLARDWLVSLSKDDQRLAAESVTFWKELIRRDWVNTQPNSLIEAQAEYFDFN